MEDKSKVKIGILSASSIQMCAIGMATAIPLMMQAFPDAGHTVIQSVVTLPSLIAIPAALLTGRVSVKTGKKNPLILGLGIMALGGLIPALFDVNLTMLLCSVVVLGVGLGIVMTISTALIPDYFKGPEGGDMLGKQSAAVNLGAMLLSGAGGLLASLHWRNTFFIFLYAIPLILIVIACIPKDSQKPKTPEDKALNDKVLNSKALNDKPSKVKISKEVYITALTIFFFGICFGILNTNNALLVHEKGMGGPSVAGLAGSFMTGTGIVMGIVYGKIAAILKNKTMALAIVVVALGMLILYFSSTPLVLYIGATVCGVGFSCFMPTCIFRATSAGGPEESPVAISIVLSAVNIALFMAPLIMNPLSSLLAGGSVQSRYLIGAVVLALLSVFVYLRMRGRN